MSETTDGKLIDELRRCGLRATNQRLAILRTLRDDPSHPSAEDLYERLRATYATLSLSTVYKTIQKLVEAGVLQTIDTGAGKQRYEGRLPAHHHAICITCGRVVDIPPDQFPIKLTTHKIHPHFRAHVVNVHFNGVCDMCDNRTKKRRR